MIVFETLLLGLVVGVRSLTFMVAPPVRSVDVRLDGATIGVLAGEPWTLRCDFGGSPHPHELVAIGRDAGGKEIGRVRQWVNMPRPEAEASLLLEPGPKAARASAARLAWNEITGADPTSVRVTLDGKTLTIASPRRFELPPWDPREAHVLSAELVFAVGRTARADVAFGGDIGGEAQSELTGLPIVLEPGSDLPPLPAIQNWFRDGDVALHVLGVEQAPFDVVLIVDRAVWGILAKEAGAKTAGAWSSGRSAQSLRLLVFEPAGSSDNRLFFASGMPDLYSGSDASTHVVFSTFGPIEFVTSKLRARLANLLSDLAVGGTQTLADAVATTGAVAAGRNRPRAVVLLLAGSTGGKSEVTPAGARAFLDDLHVPLLVWSLVSGGETDGWGTAEDVSSESRLDRAAKHLRNQLARQHIVWLEGAHLPQRIRLAEGVKGVHIAP